MRKTNFMSLLLAIFLLTIFTNAELQSEDIQVHIDWLTQRLDKRFILKDEPYDFMVQYAKKKGLYQSSIHINFLDKKNSYLTSKLRNNPIGDINMFVTSFVLYSQLQASELGTIKIDDHKFSMALQALSQFRDKNTQYGIPQYIFWPQTKINGSWVAQPVNLVNIANIFPDNLPKFVQNFLNKAGLWMILDIKEVVKIFSIPADNDDSSVNLALLGLMKQVNSKHYQFWQHLNFNKIAFYKRALKYAYRPFSKDYPYENNNTDQIDPRTYYAIHQFVQAKAQQAAQQNISPTLVLPTTWLIKQSQQIPDAVGMPFGVNNVDATVCANFLFGLAFQILTNQVSLDDLPQLKQLIKDTVDFLVFVIQKKIQQRPDIILVYYPSKYDFYWFAARITHLLKRYQNQNMPQQLIYMKYNLQKVLKSAGTDHIIKKQIKITDQQGYWVQFLGNYAGKTRNDDAMFNTAMALNALFDIWTIRNKSTLKFDLDTPDEVKSCIKKGITYVLNKIGPKMKQFNTFFSGSLKSYTTSLYIYPANVHLNQKGQNINPQNATTDQITYGMKYLMKGAMPSSDYEAETKKMWWGYPVPDKFESYNQMPFPYWSSFSITEAMLISVLSKYLKAN